MPTTYVELPANLVAERDTKWKTLYWTEYCDRAKRRLLPKRTPKKNVIQKQENVPLNRKFMKDHFPEYGHLDLKNDYEDTMVALGKHLNLTDRLNEADKAIVPGKNTMTVFEDKPLSETLPKSIEAVEKSWTEEVHSNKRERGNIYGGAGKKTYLSRAKTPYSDPADSGLMPGLNKWLKTANENEKQVVYTFLDSVSRSLQEQDHVPGLANQPTEELKNQSKKVRVSSAPTFTHRYSPARSSRSSQRSSVSSASSRGNENVITAKMPNSQQGTGAIRGRPPSPPKPALTESFMRRAKSAISVRELKSPDLEQVPLSARNPRPKSSRDSQRSGQHKHCHSHSETTCVRCRDKLIKSLIRDIEGDDESPYDMQFPGMPGHSNNRFYNTSAYYAFDPEDYVHTRSFFTNAPKGNRGYFIIHPDWVSEYKHCRPSYR